MSPKDRPIQEHDFDRQERFNPDFRVPDYDNFDSHPEKFSPFRDFPKPDKKPQHKTQNTRPAAKISTIIFATF